MARESQGKTGISQFQKEKLRMCMERNAAGLSWWPWRSHLRCRWVLTTLRPSPENYHLCKWYQENKRSGFFLNDRLLSDFAALLSRWLASPLSDRSCFVKNYDPGQRGASHTSKGTQNLVKYGGHRWSWLYCLVNVQKSLPQLSPDRSQTTALLGGPHNPE